MFWCAMTVPRTYDVDAAHALTSGSLRIMSLSSWPRTWQCHRYQESVVGLTGLIGNRFWPGATPPVGTSCGAQRATRRITWLPFARRVSFQPVSYGSGAITGP